MHDSELLKKRRDQLSPAKQALLRKWLQEESSGDSSIPSITSRSPDSPTPLSFAQRRLWFLDQLQGNPTYNLSLSVELSGMLNLDLLERSLNEVINRHEVLRTTFHSKDGEPFQVIAPSLKLTLAIEDLTACSNEEQESAVQQIAMNEARMLFRLDQGPLIRAKLLRLSETKHVAILTQHHIISDRWSLGVLLQEMAAIYQALLDDLPSPLPPLAFQYADYALWHRQWLTGQLFEEQLHYWKQQLDGAPTVLELPADRRRPARPTFQGTRVLVHLSLSLTQALHTWSQQEGVTLFMTLLAAWSILLYRYSGQEDILIGSPVANRVRPELEGLIGFFVNTLVLRSNLSGDPTVRQLVQRMREVALGAFAHQDFPFEQLVEELHLERDLSRTVLIQAVFAWQNTPLPPLEIAGLSLKPIEIDTGTAKFDLLLALEDTEQGIQGMLEYNTDIFDAPTIARMVDHYQRILEEMIARPEQKISLLPLLTPRERELLLVEWNNTHKEYERDICIHQLFERQVQRTPEAVALLFQDQQWTYQELNQWANQLAHHLKRLGIGAGKLVAVYMERSAEMLPALLGILKAGGAYVPLEANTPPARLHWILDSLQITCVITQQALRTRLATLEQLPALEHVLCLDGPLAGERHEDTQEEPYRVWGPSDLREMSLENLPVQSKPDDLAYIIFTSGSTGTPKGVMVAHSPVINLISWVNQTFQVGPTDRVLFITSLCFDLSIYDIFGILAAGGSIRLASGQDVQEPQRLLRHLFTEPITFWDSAPAALLQLTPFFSSLEQIKEQEGMQSPSLRLIFLSGDWIPVSLPDQLKATFPGVSVIGLGGATEATVWSNYYPIEEVDPQWSSIPYGKPIQNAQYYILDDYLSPCPIGVSGHLYIGGECLSLGYVNEPELTREKFLSSPFSTQAGARIYKTGDLARWRPDGNIEFLGRDDSQVKIRGFRIELGEIEAALRQHRGVKHAVVVAHGDARKERRLVAYIVPQPGPVPAITQLRAFLQQYLPEYMQPAAFVFLDTLPATSNGKLDRGRLPAPDFSAPQQSVPFVAPRDSVELQLSLIWEEVLQVSPISITANFFELGGHSLLAVQLIARIRQQFGQQLPLALLFQESTIERLAHTLRSHRSEQSASSVVGLQTVGSTSPLFFVHPGGGSVFCYVTLARHLGSDRPFYGLQTPGLNDDRVPYTDMEELAAHYVQEIRAIQPDGPYYLGGWCVGGIIAYEMARQLQSAGQEVALLALLDSAPPFTGSVSHDDDATLFAQFVWDLGRLLGTNFPASYKIALLGLVNSALSTIGDQPVDPDLVATFLADLLSELEGADPATLYQSLKQLTLNEQLQYVITRVQTANIDPPKSEQAYLLHLYSIYSLNVRAIHRYLPGISSASILLVRAQDEAQAISQEEMFTQWSKLTTGKVEMHLLPGDHYSILKEPYVQGVSECIKAYLGELKRF